MASSNFSGTITGGIQDISALLPLLGTEQCEKHVGSSLDRGFLYSSVTPISIFGSLGIVRAAFNILVASLSIPQYRLLGAKKLSDGGFTPNGIVAPVIAMDPAHPQRFLAESRLESMLADEHIENVEDLTVSSGTGIAWWNSLLVLFTVVIAAAGLIPYIVIIRHSHHSSGKFLFSSGWGFPICRVAGSVLCVNAAQFLMEIRILVLLKTRLLFLAVDRLAKEADIDLDSLINKECEGNTQDESAEVWGAELASEQCIWTLERWLRSSKNAGDPEKVNNFNYEVIKGTFVSERKRQLKSINDVIPPWMSHFLCFVLLIGIILSVGGYIGCFYLIQHSTNDSFGPLAWLILEALLSVIRIIVWAVNPAWDDSRGIVFHLQLASHAPLITCDKFQDDIEEDGVSPVTRANNFLEDVVAYTGPLPLFIVDDVALYYILTAAKGANVPRNSGLLPRAMLYIVISAYKEQTSRILVKKGGEDNSFSIYISKLEPIPGSTAINVEVDFSDAGLTQPKTHFFTANARFMDQLKSHYSEILAKLRQQTTNAARKASFGKSWAMQQSLRGKKQSNAENTTRSSPADDSHLISLTDEDLIYLFHGQVQRRWRFMVRRLEEWIELYTALYAQELLEDVPINRAFKETKPLDIIDMYEVNEAEYLLIECHTYMDSLLMATAAQWSGFMRVRHDEMIDTVLLGSFTQLHDDAARSTHSNSNERHGEGIRRGQLRSRLENERQDLFDAEARLRTDNRCSRLCKQSDATEKRIRARDYNDPMGEQIIAIWKDTVVAAKKFRTTPLRLRDEFKQEMHDRLEATLTDDRLKDKLASDFVSNHLKRMEARCAQRADRLFSRMDDRRSEFEELQSDDVLANDSHDLMAYWSHESLQERLRLLGKKHKYLRISNASINAVGGRQNMTRALSRSQDFAFVDISQSSQLTRDDIRSIVMGDKLITGLASPWQSKDEDDLGILELGTKPRFLAALEAKEDVCVYGDGVVTDLFRKGSPYLLFRELGSTVCTVYFHVLEKRDHVITLRHCMTTENGRVDILLNDHALECTWGLSREVKDGFEDEDIFIPEAYLKEDEQSNILRIVLRNDSAGVYWLSNVFLPARPNVKSETPEPV